jgi:hypothetical protein
MGAAVAELWRASDVSLVEALRAAEVRIRQAHSEMLDVLAEVERRGVATKLGYSNTSALLMSAVRVSRREARHRCDQVEDLRSRTTPTGSVVEAALPQTADALARGEIGSDHVDVIRKTLKDLTDFGPGQLADAETVMLGRAAQDDPKALERFGFRVREIIDPDGPRPSDKDPQRPERQLQIHTHRSGVTEFKGYLDPVNGPLLTTLVKLLDTPLVGEVDDRGYAERAADAFVDILKKASNCPDLPTHNGLKTEMALIVDVETLETKLQDAVLPGQTYLTARDARLLACDAHVLPAVMGGDSKPLDVTVPAYVVPAHIRRGLVLRDRGCAFPGCAKPGSACDSHHIRQWLRGGPTQLDNLVLLCSHHHRLIHRSEWTVSLVNDWAYFTPPAYIDPLQQPRYNPLHRTRLPATT